MTTAKKSNITNAIGPQNGKVTHHQDQAIVLVNLSTTKTIPNKVVVLIPDFTIIIYLILLII